MSRKRLNVTFKGQTALNKATATSIPIKRHRARRVAVTDWRWPDNAHCGGGFTVLSGSRRTEEPVGKRCTDNEFIIFFIRLESRDSVHPTKENAEPRGFRVLGDFTACEYDSQPGKAASAIASFHGDWSW